MVPSYRVKFALPFANAENGRRTNKWWKELRKQQARREDLAKSCVVFRRGTHHEHKMKLKKNTEPIKILDTLDSHRQGRSGEKALLEATVQKTLKKHRTRLEQTCDTPRGSGKTERSRVIFMSDAKRSGRHLDGV